MPDLSTTGLAELEAIYERPEEHARRHHDSGGLVIGYIANNVPVELIVAAGAFALEVRGDPNRLPTTGDRYMEPFHDGPARSIFSRLLDGEFSYLDLLVIPRSSETWLQLYYYLLEAKKWEPELKLPEIFLFDLLQTPFWTSGRYVRKQVGALAARIGAVTGVTLDDATVNAGIDTVNASRRQLADLNRLRRSDPPRVSGRDVLLANRASGAIPPDAHVRLVAELTRHAEDAPPLSGPRLMVKGSQHDSTLVYDVLADLGAVVVADDHVTGERVFEATIEVGDRDPLQALTRYYQFESLSPRSYPQDRQDERFLEIVRDAAVQGVVFFLEENDDTLGWDYPEQKRLLDEAGVPSIYLPYQPYFHPNAASLRASLEPFVLAIDAGDLSTLGSQELFA